MSRITVKMLVVSIDHSPEVTISGDSIAVLRIVALVSGLRGEDAVAIRPSTNDDGTTVVVDASQAEEYPQFLGEIVADVDDDDSPAPIPNYAILDDDRGYTVIWATSLRTSAMTTGLPVDHPNALIGDHQIWKSAGELMHEEGVTYGTMQQASDAIDIIRSAYATGPVPEMAPGAEDRAVERAEREGVLR